MAEMEKPASDEFAKALKHAIGLHGPHAPAEMTAAEIEIFADDASEKADIFQDEDDSAESTYWRKVQRVYERAADEIRRIQMPATLKVGR